MALKHKNSHPEESYTNKLFQTLWCLEPSELKRLIKYLNSPYFNQSKTLVRLCEVLINAIQANRSSFDRQQIWAAVFNREKYDDVNFRKYCSDLLKLVEDFMAQETSNNDPERRKIDLLSFVARRKVEPLYNSLFRQIHVEMNQKPYHSLEYFKNMYTIERLYYSIMGFDVKLNARANIEEIGTNLDLFYWIEKLKLYSTVLSQRRTGNYNYNLQFNNEILNYLKNFPLDEVPELAVYYYSFLTLYEEENEEHYFKLRRLLDQYGTLMTQKEAVELYDSALHYCTGKLNKGNNIFLQEHFDLFEDGLQKGIFIINGELATWRFNNAVAAALHLGKFEWAEEFIERYMRYLPGDTRQNTHSFNLARVYRYQGKFDKVLALLRNLEYEDIGYNLISKTMLINSYYELDEHDALESAMESFRVFLNRHKNIPQQRRKSYLNLLKYVRRLTRIKPGDKMEIEKLREEVVREKSNHVNRQWLLEKIAELE